MIMSTYDEPRRRRTLALEVHAELVPLEAHAVRLARRVGRIPTIEVADARLQAPPVAADLDVVDPAIPVEEVVQFSFLDVVGKALVRRRPRPRDVAPDDAPVQLPAVHAQGTRLGLRLLLEGHEAEAAGPAIVVRRHVDVSYFPVLADGFLHNLLVRVEIEIAHVDLAADLLFRRHARLAL